MLATGLYAVTALRNSLHPCPNVTHDYALTRPKPSWFRPKGLQPLGHMHASLGLWGPGLLGSQTLQGVTWF